VSPNFNLATFRQQQSFIYAFIYLFKTTSDKLISLGQTLATLQKGESPTLLPKDRISQESQE